MADTETRAERFVAGGTLYLRRASKYRHWEINTFTRDLNPRTFLGDGILLSEQLQEHPVLQKTFATADQAASVVRGVLA
jgi:hypothetical protein